MGDVIKMPAAAPKANLRFDCQARGTWDEF